jgi:hypothetical protein
MDGHTRPDRFQARANRAFPSLRLRRRWIDLPQVNEEVSHTDNEIFPCDVVPTVGCFGTQYTLDAPPAWDGLAAANGQLFMVTQDGKVICFGQDKK